MSTDARVNDGALDAVAFLEAVIEANTYNWEWLLDNTDRNLLLVGMTKVAKSLLLEVAAARGKSPSEALATQRILLLAEGDAA